MWICELDAILHFDWNTMQIFSTPTYVRPTLFLLKLNLTSWRLFSNVIGSFDLCWGRWRVIWLFIWLHFFFLKMNIFKYRERFFLNDEWLMKWLILVLRRNFEIHYFEMFGIPMSYFAPKWPPSKKCYWSWKISI